MSVEYRDKYRMPQPEQWLSEHPWWQLAIFGAAVGLLYVLLRWVGV